MKIQLFFAAMLLVLIVSGGCKKDDEESLPVVMTLQANEITSNSVVLYGEVTEEGGSGVSQRGFCYSAAPDPGLNDSTIQVNSGPGAFSVEITGLKSGRIYYYKAFATNGKGTALGEEKSFTTDTEVDPGPSLTLKGGSGYTSNDVTISTGTTIKVGVVGGISSVSGNKLTRFKLVFTSGNIPATLFDTTLNTGVFDWETNLTFTNEVAGTLSFELTDMGNMKATKTIHITVTGPETIKYSNIEMGSWNDVNGSFFSTSEGIVYNITQTMSSPANQAKIDFLFFKGTVNGNTIAAPDDVDANTIPEYKLNLWTNRNQTRFNAINISAAQFDAIGANYEFPDFEPDVQTTKMNQLAVGDVFLFKTQGNKPGLVKIVSLYTRGDKMKIDVIMEK